MISPEAAGAGFAVAVVPAEQFRGQETSSFAAGRILTIVCRVVFSFYGCQHQVPCFRGIVVQYHVYR